MFRKELSEKLKAIFQVSKTTFEAPSESFEEDTLFIEISSAPTRFSAGRVALAKVTGQLVVFSQEGKFPFGFFGRKIEQAAKEATIPFFFYEIDTEILNSPARMVNLHERRCSFLFLFKADYDPNQGELTSIGFVPDEPLEAPSDLQGFTTGTGALLTWTDHSRGERGFKIYRALEDVEASYKLIGSVGSGIREYHDNTIPVLIPHFYKILAYYPGFPDSEFSNVCPFTREVE